MSSALLGACGAAVSEAAPTNTGTAGAGSSPPTSAGTAAIFTYHHVSPTVLPGPYALALTVTPAEFRDQLGWLRARGCRVVSVDDLYLDVERNTLAGCEAALTFDDGYDDAATYALPLLRAFHDPGTFYIATGYLGTPGHVSLAQLRSMRSAGMEIGAHTVHHVDLTIVPRAEATREIEASAVALRAWLGVAITSFAYPAGRFDAQVMASARAARFENAVTTQPGDVAAASDRYELPRYRIERGQGMGLLEAVFGGPEGTQAASALGHIARQRIAGNAPAVAEAIAVALLGRSFPEQILKVHVVAMPPATVAGIVLSGVKFHHAVDRARFEADVSEMIALALRAAPGIDEVDVWATIPQAVRAGVPVSGDYAVPATKTVFSCAVRRAASPAKGSTSLGATYWDSDFLP